MGKYAALDEPVSIFDLLAPALPLLMPLGCAALGVGAAATAALTAHAAYSTVAPECGIARYGRSRPPVQVQSRQPSLSRAPRRSAGLAYG